MHRPRSTWFLLVMLAVLESACSGGGEQQLLSQYFNAAKLRDNTTLSNIATVQFNPDSEGIVQDFSVTTVGEEQTRQVPLLSIRKAFDDATATEAEFSKRKKEYQDANIQAIDRVLKAERSNAKPGGRDAEVQTAWTKWRDEMATHAKQVNDARTQLSDARGVVEASMFNPSNPIDVAEFDATISRKDVTIAAEIRTPAGDTVQKNMVVTLERAAVKNAERELTGRWIITAMRDA